MDAKRNRKKKPATVTTDGAQSAAEDFFGPDFVRTWNAVTKRREAEWALVCAEAELDAVNQGIDPADPEAVHADLEKAIRAYSAAATDGKKERELLPNEDGRIIRARRENNELVAAMLYREAAWKITHAIPADAEAEYFKEQEEKMRSAIIKEYERKKATNRPGKYIRHGDGKGLTQDEAAEIMIQHHLGTNPDSIKRKIRRWASGKGNPPPDYPGLADYSQFILWATQVEQRTQIGIRARDAMDSRKRMQYRETATEAGNMRLTGKPFAQGAF
jgi:hypothetical protein